MTTKRLGTALVAVLLLASCSVADQQPASPSSASVTPPSAPATTSAPSSVTIALAGDVHFERHLAPLARNPQGLASLKSSLGAADLSILNLETSITERGEKQNKAFTFRAPASALVTLQNAGVDVASLANNHGVDYGRTGLADTLAAKKSSPIPLVGIGANEDEAFAPAIVNVKGMKVAVFGATQVWEETLANFSAGPSKGGVASSAPVKRLVAGLKKVRPQVDVVIAFLHWGMDYIECPSSADTSTARALAEAGADVVAGGHSHRAMGHGWLGPAYVAYGLGNFVWWKSVEPDSRSGVLTLTVDAARARSARGPRTSPVVSGATWTPMLIGADGIPAVARGADEKRLRTSIAANIRCAGLRTSPSS